MNKRLRDYLRSLGLKKEATDEEAIDFLDGLRGLPATIANLLDHAEDDTQARSSADVALRAMGVDPSNPSRMLDAVEVEDDEPVGERSAVGEDAERRGAEQERQRARTIADLAELAGVPADLRNQAVSEGWDVARASEAFAEFRRNTQSGVPAAMRAPAGHSRSSQTDFTRDSLVAAMMLREGVADPTRTWPVRTLDNGQLRTADRSSDAAVGRAVDRGAELAGLSMVEIARRALELDGVRTEPTASGIGRAIAERNGIGLATLTGVFSTSYSAVLIAAYEAAPDTTAGWTTTQGVRDYKTNERTRMGAMSRLKKRRAGEEAAPSTFSDAVETYKVSEFAQQFTFDEQNLINDSFDALEGYAPRDMGLAAAEIRPDLVYSVLLANAAMRDGTALFHANHGNLITSSALGVGALASGRAKIRVQKDGTRNLNLAATHLIVPPALGHTAYGVAESEVVVTGVDAIVGSRNSNAVAGLTIVEDARLENGVVDPDTETSHAGSATTWFLATGNGRAMIEVGFIRELGDRPRVRSTVLTMGKFGINFDVQHSLGAKALDWRGLLKATA